jgi:DNA-binding transcriptional LysR family regulator
MKKLDLKNILTFVTVARDLSFVQAAQNLYLSQPSVTARIQALEVELGAPLFIRNSRRTILLSKEGETFLPYALKMLEIAEESQDKLKRINSLLEGKISIGATAFLSSYVLPEILGEIYKKYPKIEFKVMTGNTSQISDMLMQNIVDIGLISSKVKKPQIKQVLLDENEEALICGPQHPFSLKKVIEMEELLANPLVTYEQSSDVWRRINKVYAEHGAVPNVVMEMNQIDAVKSMVRVGNCLCFLPVSSVESELSQGNLVKVHVKELNKIKTTCSMIYLEKKENYPLISLMLGTLRRHFKVFS